MFGKKKGVWGQWGNIIPFFPPADVRQEKKSARLDSKRAEKVFSNTFWKICVKNTSETKQMHSNGGGSLRMS